MDRKLLEENLELVTHRDPNATARFYDRLFARCPHLRDLFGANAAPVQEEMLTETLVSALDTLDNGVWVECNMELLGAKHREFAVTHEMYEWWTDCVIDTLAELSASDWSPVLERLWRDRIGHLCTLMRNAAVAAPG